MRHFGFSAQCLIALILGLVIGKFLPPNIILFIEPFGNAYLKLLKLIIIPLTFTTIVSSFSRIKNITTLRKLSLRTIFWFLATSIFAAIVGLGIGDFFNPGVGLFHLMPQNYTTPPVPSIGQTFLNMVPGNIIKQIAAEQIIPVIIFAIIFGLALTTQNEKCKTVGNFFNEFQQIMLLLTRKIIRLSPYGIFALLVPLSNNYGMTMLLMLGKFFIAIVAACTIQLIVYAILLTSVAKKNPVVFFKEFWPAMITAFSTSSSLGTLPVTLETLFYRVKVRPEIASFVAPLGATMKMDGCGTIYPIIVSIFTAQALGIDLTHLQLFLIAVTAVIATLGTAGVPGTAIITASIVLMSAGLPLNGLAMVAGIDRILDMIRTTTNVTGCGVCAVLVDTHHSPQP